MMNKILVTGSTGCIGKATVDYLISQGIERVYGYNRSTPSGSLPEGFQVVQGDISDTNRLRDVLRKIQPDVIIHLAALQTPDCQANPFLGMDINLVSTAHIFRAVAEEVKDLKRFVFASSAAVHGPRDLHPAGLVGPNALFAPPNLYGFWKTAGEGIAQAFHMETQVPTVSLRLATTYGPGRDRGLTSAPTTAMKACALGLDYKIPYQGREHYHYVKDVGAGFGEAAIAPFMGYDAFHLPGRTIEITKFCENIKQIALEMGIENPGIPTVLDGSPTMPFTCDLDHLPTTSAFPKMKLTNVEDGIRHSLEFYISEINHGLLSRDDIL